MILAHKRAMQLCVCFLSHTLCGKVKGGLTRVRGTDWLCSRFSWTQLYSSYRDEVMCKKSLMTSAGDDNFRLAPGSRPYLSVTTLTKLLCTGPVPRHYTLWFQDLRQMYRR